MLGTQALGTKDAAATVGVRDIAVAKKFYEGTLGLTPTDTREAEVAAFTSGRTALLAYRSKFAGTNEATAVTWVVGDELEGIVQGLKAKGVKFEHYDMPGMKREGDLHVSGGMKAAWFKDPDGNILCLVNG